MTAASNLRDDRGADASYLRPFTSLMRMGVSHASVTQSLKFSRGRVEGNRYFVRFAPSPRSAHAAAQTVRAMQLPYAAEGRVALDGGGWSAAGALGAAWMDGRTSYRAYFRSGVERAGEIYGRAVEWTAGQPPYNWRDYTLLAESDIGAVAARIAEGLEIAPRSAENAALRALEEFLRASAASVSLLAVTDAGTGRVSFDLSPNYEGSPRLEDAGALLDRWWSAFEAREGAIENDWHRRAGQGVLENLAIGRDGSGCAFTTIYCGKFERPLPLLQPPVTKVQATPAAPRRSVHQGAGSPIFVLGRIGYEWNTRQPERSTPEAEDDVTWTLHINGTPVYTLAPDAAVQSLWAQCLRDQDCGQAELICVPGLVCGSLRMRDGTVLPEIEVNPRGVFWWSAEALWESIQPAPEGLRQLLRMQQATLRNTGAAALDRALNFVATQPAALAPSFRMAESRGLHFETIQARTDRWGRCEVRLQFGSARPGLSRLTAVVPVDVREPIPVFAGPVRCWESA